MSLCSLGRKCLLTFDGASMCPGRWPPFGSVTLLACSHWAPVTIPPPPTPAARHPWVLPVVTSSSPGLSVCTLLWERVPVHHTFTFTRSRKAAPALKHFHLSSLICGLFINMLNCQIFKGFCTLLWKLFSYFSVLFFRYHFNLAVFFWAISLHFKWLSMAFKSYA